MKKDKDFSTGILYEDSFEDRPLDDTGESSEHSTGILKKFLSMKRWKKIVLCVVTAVLLNRKDNLVGFQSTDPKVGTDTLPVLV